MRDGVQKAHLKVIHTRQRKYLMFVIVIEFWNIDDFLFQFCQYLRNAFEIPFSFELQFLLIESSCLKIFTALGGRIQLEKWPVFDKNNAKFCANKKLLVH